VAFVLNQRGRGFVSVIDAVSHKITSGNFGAGIVIHPFALGAAILPGATSLYVDNQFATINNLLVMTGTLKDVDRTNSYPETS